MNHKDLVSFFIYRKEASKYLRLLRQLAIKHQDEKGILKMNKIIEKHKKMSDELVDHWNDKLKRLHERKKKSHLRVSNDWNKYKTISFNEFYDYYLKRKHGINNPVDLLDG